MAGASGSAGGGGQSPTPARPAAPAYQWRAAAGFAGTPRPCSWANPKLNAALAWPRAAAWL